MGYVNRLSVEYLYARRFARARRGKAFEALLKIADMLPDPGEREPDEPPVYFGGPYPLAVALGYVEEGEHMPEWARVRVSERIREIIELGALKRLVRGGNGRRSAYRLEVSAVEPRLPGEGS